MVLKKKIVIGCLFVGVAVLAACGGGGTAEAPTTDGLSIYNSNCKSCHGDDGKLGLSGAADLSSSTLTVEEKNTIVSDGKGGMMPYRELLNKEQIKAVVKHIETLKQ